MQGTWLAGVAMLATLAGCLDDPAAGVEVLGPAATAEPPPALRFHGTCDNALLFQFVEYADTDPYLPPGFHPRDPQAFLNSPAAFGQAGVLLLVLDCADANGTRHAAASTAIFVEAPVVEGLEPSRFNFYEVERVEPPGPFTPLLTDMAWPLAAGDVRADVTLGMLTDTAAGTARVTDGEGEWASFSGTMDAPIPLGNATVRFWHDGSSGLAYLEYGADLQPIAGGGICSLREGTAVADFAKSTPAGDVAPLTALACPPADPIVATFPDFAVNVTAGSFPGVHAQ